MLLSAPAAHAGHWVFSVGGKDGNGKATSTFTPIVTGNKSPALPTWSPPRDSSNSLTVSFPGVMARDDQTVSNPSCSCTVNATLTILATWTHDTGQTDANDPAPTSVWIIENSGASWQGATTGPIPGGGDDGGPPPPSPFSCSGSASDGVPGDQQYYKALPVGGPYTSGSVTTPAQTTAPPAPAGWSTQPVNGKTFTITRSLSANGTAGYTGPCSVSMSCSLGPYTVSIHAQPYNYHQTSVTDNGDGTLNFTYSWSSTSGNTSGLNSCVVYEHVVYPGTHGTPSNPIPYQPPSPPYNTDWSSANNPNGMKDPTELPNPKWPAQNIGPGYTYGDNNLIAGSFILPQDNVTSVDAPFTATQTYVFDDGATGEAETQIPGGASGGSGPFSITREVKNNTTPSPPYASPYGYVYTISKNGTTARKVLTP